MCRSIRKSLYDKAHRAENNRTKQTWRKANPDKRQAESLRYRVKHREKLRAAARLYATIYASEIRLRRMLVPLARRQAYCRQWALANPERRTELSARRRARLAQAPRIEKIDREAIYLRDRWICQLCHARVNPAIKYPHPDSPTLDHVIPLSQGGHHTHQNLVLTHSRCNIGKRDRPRTQQLRLFG